MALQSARDLRVVTIVSVCGENVRLLFRSRQAISSGAKKQVESFDVPRWRDVVWRGLVDLFRFRVGSRGGLQVATSQFSGFPFWRLRHRCWRSFVDARGKRTIIIKGTKKKEERRRRTKDWSRSNTQYLTVLCRWHYYLY